ncbi:MAG: histone deacetylase family protein [Pseudomonadota bacterium]|nr:histone deacetylase family protein [Pseudomonadota bacterium]
MTTLLYHHPVFLEHDTGAFHPECPARLKAILDALRQPGFAALAWREAPQASREQLNRVHPQDYVEAILAAIPAAGQRALDPDTVISPRSGEAALRAAGAVCAAVDAVMANEARTAFCAVRPPGHHAEPGRAMGFCLFNNVAVGALHAVQGHGLRRVAVVDFDVHHGNGTQAAFLRRPECLYISSHQWPLYPGTGHVSERGVGNIVNLPLPPGSGSEELRDAWTDGMAPALHDFRPEFIFISAGFDAHHADPLAGLAFTEDDYGWITREILAIAQDYSQGRVVSALEGGYNLPALAACAAVHVKALMEG